MVCIKEILFAELKEKKLKEGVISYKKGVHL